MADDDLVVVKQFFNKYDAEIAKGVLESNGIDSVIFADDLGGYRPHLCMGDVRLLVRRNDLEDAREMLKDWTPPNL